MQNGDTGNRNPGLVLAKDALYHKLSHIPNFHPKVVDLACFNLAPADGATCDDLRRGVVDWLGACKDMQARRRKRGKQGARKGCLEIK